MDEINDMVATDEQLNEAENEALVVYEETAEIVEKKKKSKKKKKEKENDGFLPEINKEKSLWTKSVDDRGNIYYFHTVSGESTWLGPCCTCFKRSVKWCIDCGKSFCSKDFDSIHNNPDQPEYKKHNWSNTEISQRDQIKENEEYCIGCNTKVASRICTDCWDSYCSDCFKKSHSMGYLKYHKAVAYQRVRMGWYCVRKFGKEPDYYVNGATGTTTYDKPDELMTELEAILNKNFKAFKATAEQQVEMIEKLQFELEAAKYERDKLLVESMARKANEGEEQKNSKSAQVLENAKKSNRSGLDNEYRNMLMTPSDRRRGQARTNYIKSLIDNPDVTS